MKPKAFLNQLDETRLVAAIREAERHTSGEIRVFVSSRHARDPVAKARAQFLRLGMERTRRRNAVLIYFAPQSRRFAVVGDEGVHARCGEAFWNGLAETMRAALAQHHFTEAAILAVERCGALLAEHFPPEPGGDNELSDTIGRE